MGTMMTAAERQSDVLVKTDTHPIPHPHGQAMGYILRIWEKTDPVISAPHCIRKLNVVGHQQA